VRVNDLINQARLNPVDALDAMTSFAVADEGTNTLYLGLVDTVCKRDSFEDPYTI
jgi:hypothetical protein